MAKIIIERKVSLAFLGQKYKDSYLLFQAIPVGEYEKYLDKISDNKDDNKKSIRLVLQTLKTHFLGGKFSGENGLEDIDKEDLEQFDGETIIHAFQALTGGKTDPKA